MERITTPRRRRRAPPELPSYEVIVELAAAARRAGQLEAVARGAGVGYWWMRSFSRGQIEGASYQKVAAVYRHLTLYPPPIEGALELAP